MRRSVLAPLAVLLTALVALPAIAAPMQQAGTNPGITNLIWWTSLDQTSGTRYDSTSNHIDFADTNGTGYAAGKQGNAADFVYASSQYISYASDANVETGEIDFTIGCWVYINSTPENVPIITKDPGGVNPREFGLIMLQSSSRFRFYVSGNIVGGINNVTDNTTTVTTGTWNFVIGWRDQAADTGNIQVNNNTPVSAAHVGTVATNTTPIMMGGRADGSRADARLDECFMYKRVLTTDERTWLYNGGSGRIYTELIPPTATPTSTDTPTNTPTATATDTLTPTITNTPTASATVTNTLTPTLTPTITPSPTNTLTATPIPFGLTATFPLGGAGYSVQYSATFGDLLIATGLFAIVLVLVPIFWTLARPKLRMKS